MTRTLAIVALLLTANCSQQDQPAPAPADNVAAAPAAPASPPTKTRVPLLEGKWHVTSADGLTANFSGGRVAVAEGCLRRSWSYTQNGNSVGFKTAPGGSSNCGHTPSAALDHAFGVLVDANLAVFSADGGEVTLTGLGGPLQLERR